MKLTNLKTKLGLLALAAFGATALGMAGSAEAAPGKRRVTKAQFTQIQNAHLAQAMMDFKRMDKNGSGVLNRADFASVSMSYQWKRTPAGWRKLPVRSVKVDAKYHQLLRTADFNKDGQITYSEYRRARLIGFNRNIAPSYIVIAPRPLPRPVTRPLPHPVIKAKVAVKASPGAGHVKWVVKGKSHR